MSPRLIKVLSTDIFHVHTYRCGHAEEVSDEAYIQKALSLGATGIWFTDHAPFPGDPFRGRMMYHDLPEYIASLSRYKKLYAGQIDVHIGLEIEYFPSFIPYYEELRSIPEIELLLLGQHMAEDAPGRYSFSWEKDRLKNEEFLALGVAIVAGVQSGYFDAVAHPDRIYRRRKEWDEHMEMMAVSIIEAACSRKTPLEVNVSSQHHKYHFWPQFWDLVPGDAVKITGRDAHFVRKLDYYEGRF